MCLFSNNLADSPQHKTVHMVSWQDQPWTWSSCWSPLSSAGCQIFKLSLQIPLQLSLGKPLRERLIGSYSEKVAFDLNGGVSLCFGGTESKLSWRAGFSSPVLWSVHREHEKSHLPFCLLIYRQTPLLWQWDLCWKAKCTLGKQLNLGAMHFTGALCKMLHSIFTQEYCSSY